MHISRLAANNQAIIPQEVRDALGLKEGDEIAFSVENGQAVLRKASVGDAYYLKAVESTLSEWSTTEDDDAFRDL
jgi:antitoxin PrlF